RRVTPRCRRRPEEKPRIRSKKDDDQERCRGGQSGERIVDRRETVLLQTANDSPERILPADANQFVAGQKLLAISGAFNEPSQVHIVENVESQPLEAP